jgi:hypothetical protein
MREVKKLNDENKRLKNHIKILTDIYKMLSEENIYLMHFIEKIIKKEGMKNDSKSNKKIWR